MGLSAGTGWPGAMILPINEILSLMCSFYLSVAARKARSGSISETRLRYRCEEVQTRKQSGTKTLIIGEKTRCV